MPIEVKDIPVPRPAFRHEELVDYELFWRDSYEWLKSRGYLLRARYEPNWKPSWEGTDKLWDECEDASMIWFPQINDAIRISDGKIVALKKVNERVHPHETDIAQLFSVEPLASDPTNHCIPIYEVLRNPNDQEHVLLVMPFLRKFDNPRFDTFGEAVECFTQIFEGLQFMHKNHVAHRDCTLLNLMMDATQLYPEPYHPVKTYMKRDFSGKAKHFTRTRRPTRYYWVDFGLSRHYPQDGTPMEAPIWGGDKTVPEFQNSNEPRNPFPTDIYYLGSLIRETFIQEKIGFDFMQPLVADMVQDDPNQRPTIDEVVARFEKIRQDLGSWKLRSRVVKRWDSMIPSIYRSITHWYRRITFIMTRTPSVPKA